MILHHVSAWISSLFCQYYSLQIVLWTNASIYGLNLCDKSYPLLCESILLIFLLYASHLWLFICNTLYGIPFYIEAYYARLLWFIISLRVNWMCWCIFPLSQHCQFKLKQMSRLVGSNVISLWAELSHWLELSQIKRSPLLSLRVLNKRRHLKKN